MNHLQNAIRKCQSQYGGNWGGYLQPKEILALRDIGIKLHPKNVEIAIEWKRLGICGGLWAYFDANDEFKEIKGV